MLFCRPKFHRSHVSLFYSVEFRRLSDRYTIDICKIFVVVKRSTFVILQLIPAMMIRDPSAQTFQCISCSKNSSPIRKRMKRMIALLGTYHYRMIFNGNAIARSRSSCYSDMSAINFQFRLSWQSRLRGTQSCVLLSGRWPSAECSFTAIVGKRIYYQYFAATASGYKVHLQRSWKCRVQPLQVLLRY